MGLSAAQQKYIHPSPPSPTSHPCPPSQPEQTNFIKKKLSEGCSLCLSPLFSLHTSKYEVLMDGKRIFYNYISLQKIMKYSYKSHITLQSIPLQHFINEKCQNSFSVFLYFPLTAGWYESLLKISPNQRALICIRSCITLLLVSKLVRDNMIVVACVEDSKCWLPECCHCEEAS